MNYLYKFSIASIILIVSLNLALRVNYFPEEYFNMQIFIIAMLCGYSINEVYRFKDGTRNI